MLSTKSKNPVEQIFEKNRPFIYFHTYDVTQNELKNAVQAGKSLEVDVSMSEDGNIFIGHPLSFYDFKNLPLPNNLPFEQAINTLKDSNLYLVLDCKDVRSLPRLGEIVADFGPGRVLFHSWVDSLLFKPYPPEITIEPHWPYEDLPYEKVVEFRNATGAPTIISARGLTQERLAREGSDIVTQVIEAANSVAVAVNFNLPNGEAPPKEVVDQLLGEKILTWLNIDKVPEHDRPELYLGASDFIENASDPKEFE